ncbi:MAG TPA: hypothetical protein VJ546_09790 [Bacillales bacterium]|nr:hypothetical protein [Bacillales bacterium]
MKKKFKQILIGVVALTSLIPTSAFAASGLELPSYPMNNGSQVGIMTAGWQTLDTVYQYYDSQYQASKIYYSGGGDFRACTYDVSTAGARGMIEFWSDDPSGDRFIGWGNFADNTCVVADVRPYVDGTNGKAEIYVKVGNVRPSTWATMQFQD